MDDDRVKEDEKLNYNKYEFLKRSLQLVFSVSVFCLFAAWYYYYYSSGLSMLSNNTLERKYMFVICNLIILAFLANTFDDSPPPSNEIYYTHKLKAPPILVKDVEEQIQQLKTQQELYHEPVSEAEAEEHFTLKVNPTEAPFEEEEVVEDDDDDEEEEEEGFMVEEDEEVADKTMDTKDLELESTEELNRKFEEFIRRMKEEIRIEPQRHVHPIAV